MTVCHCCLFWIHSQFTFTYIDILIFYTLIMENTCEISLACIWILFEKCINKAWVWQLI